MTRNPLIVAALALSVLLTGCSNRSLGNKIDDQFLEPEVAKAVADAAPDLTSPTSHVVTTAYNGVILLAGQTPRAELKEKAEQAARNTRGVRKVHNDLQILKPNSALARSNDAALTTKVKSSMLFDSSVPSSRIKVVTENGIVYLLGLVTRQEGANATNVVQGVSGVQRIVQLFQYTD
ncbi:BON domain-containing protein [Pseudomonas sp. LRF_L74]|uniref:BON domain-containing protein n=1 Tax=Pseudomonas sp. LRF_L74 TaxID=3369422 RepID=UPI003F609477